MKATIEFTLPDEQAEFEASANGQKVISIITDLDHALRNMQKYDGKETIEIEKVRNMIREGLEDVGMTFNALYF
jgi:hypothetical protein